EIFAEYVHYNSLRYDKPFVKVSLSALSSDLLESELFGHEKGSFTSAHTEKKGLFEIADTGSIFLDDIDDVPLEIQTKLLRVLESHELMRIGGTKPIPIDVRVITASKVDLKLLIEKGRFRSDLFYRINVVPVQIPPLRERREDIRPLVNYFFGYYAPEEEFELSDDALRAIESYSWPGNVRELRNVIQRLTLLTEGSIDTHDLPIEIKNEDPQEIILKACDRCFVDNKMSFESVVNCLEVNLLRQALSRAECNQTQAAKMLNMSLSTFRDKIKKYNVDCSTNH
ncbi:MAG: sigma-54 dependent transcriptional regulator, partial [Melioribacteraceae bacterium]|nr:sigma-54 dependent transcriptional regulator [Melioribacteraceae bacterium]